MVFVVGHVHPEERCTHTGHPHTGVSVLTTHVHTGTGVHTLATRVYTCTGVRALTTCVYAQAYMCSPHVCTDTSVHTHHVCVQSGTGVHACTTCVHTGERVLTTHVHIGTGVPILTTRVHTGVCALTTSAHRHASHTTHMYAHACIGGSVYCTPVRTHHTQAYRPHMCTRVPTCSLCGLHGRQMQGTCERSRV